MDQYFEYLKNLTLKNFDTMTIIGSLLLIIGTSAFVYSEIKKKGYSYFSALIVSSILIFIICTIAEYNMNYDKGEFKLSTYNPKKKSFQSNSSNPNTTSSSNNSGNSNSENNSQSASIENIKDYDKIGQFCSEEYERCKWCPNSYSVTYTYDLTCNIDIRDGSKNSSYKKIVSEMYPDIDLTKIPEQMDKRTNDELEDGMTIASMNLLVGWMNNHVKSKLVDPSFDQNIKNDIIKSFKNQIKVECAFSKRNDYRNGYCSRKCYEEGGK